MGNCHSDTTVLSPAVHALKPIDLGNGVYIATPVILAPMSGVTDLPFRRLTKQLGAGMVVSEMIASWAMIRENRKTLGMAEMDGCGGVSALQLAGCDPAAMAEAARLGVDKGADLIDINFGCPVKKVLGRCRGGYLLTTPFTALDIVKSVLDHVGGRRPVTVKMRRGFDDSAESERNFFGRRPNASVAITSNSSSDGALTVRQARGSAKGGSAMGAVLGDRGRSAKMREKTRAGP
jgi:tRNA-dihydrouridine synthase